VKYEVRDRVASIEIDDGKANAMNSALIAEVSRSLDRAEAEANAIVLSGRPGRFCAGFDLAELGDAKTAGALVQAGARLLAKIYAYPRPVTIACTGHALGLGALFLLAGDYRLGVAGDYKIALNEVAIGLTMPKFGVIFAEDRVSLRHRTRALLLAETYSPAGAIDAGFLDRLSPAADLQSDAFADALNFSRLDANAHARTKASTRGDTAERILASLES